jgi:hypothetical protein
MAMLAILLSLFIVVRLLLVFFDKFQAAEALKRGLFFVQAELERS